MLYAPKIYGSQPTNFYDASDNLINEVVGGCGAGGVGDLLVPDRILGVSVKPACAIHDWMYQFGETLEDKKLSDRVFLNNMVRIINKKGGWLRWFRLIIARRYYDAVRYFGGAAFWDDKN